MLLEMDLFVFILVCVLMFILGSLFSYINLLKEMPKSIYCLDFTSDIGTEYDGVEGYFFDKKDAELEKARLEKEAAEVGTLSIREINVK